LLIGVFYKARLATIILFIYSFFYLKELINVDNIKKFIGIWFTFSFILLFALIVNNERFNDLIKIDVYFRLLPWERILFGIEFRDIFFGVGTGNYALTLYKLQNTLPSIEIIFAKDTFLHAHNFLIDRFISGGVFVLLGYLLIYIIIIKEFFKKTDKYNDQKYLFHAFLMGLTLSLFDVVHNHISGYLIFQLITLSLLTVIFNKSENIKIHTYASKMLLTIPVIFMIFQFGVSGNHHTEYNKLVNMINSKKLTEGDIDDFNNKFPHYAEIDTIKFYYKLFKKNMKFEENMENDYRKMNTYNKFSQQRLHFSSQYYSVKNYDVKLIDVYEDILYKNLISSKVIPPNYPLPNIKISITRKTGNLLFNTVKCCSLDIPEDMFSQIKFVNSGTSGLKIAEPSIDFVVNNAIYAVDTFSREKDTKLMKQFFHDVNQFSELLKF
jgi:hypothetical protein